MIITLGVASSISSYKAAEILRLLQKAGHTVRVAMTRNATRFVRPITFASLSAHPVYLDEFRAKQGEVMHVELARQTQLLVVAPATANIIGKFASGIADDFLSTLFLARRCPALIAPAMNVWMYRNPIVQQNIQRLKDAGVHFVEPEEGWLACGDEGAGRLAPPEEIAARALSLLISGKALNGKHVVVTAGPTWEALDPVRVLTNRSSGKMGYAIAEEAAGRGARVTLISGPTQILPPLNVELVRVESAEQMKNAVLEAFESADYVIKTAAVSDFRPAEVHSAKRKKTGKAEIIELEPTEDILALLGRRKQKQILVGFCAETENLESNARGKLERKNLDVIVANLVSGELDPFQSEQNQVLILDRIGGRRELPLQRKT
ncbi:MAG TPA: bifunctional phosphopantothenoylcysteine decarboxylase/phosphopantothenate--cysteine ligase CoaBC, partial [Acidobacteriota bacterium]|nr:bifunctional phosphopantothenoylcysteine decarboxylase/phosphopantothenate--cysteine ligase CoaBC [Acidobacteriota bacterium]